MKVLFFAVTKSSFVKTDYTLLKEKTDLKDFVFNPSGAFSILISMIRSIFFILKHRKNTDFIYVWFADYHSFWPVFLGKKFGIPCYVAMGGSDSQYMKKYNYGNIYGPFGLRKKCVIYSLKYATHLFPCDECLIEDVNDYIPGERYEYGAKHLIDNFSTPYTVQAFSIDESIWYVEKKKDYFVTVTWVPRERTRLRKSIDFYLEVAEAMPDYRFYLIGVADEIQKNLRIPKNAIVKSFVEWDSLKKLLAEAKVFSLFSFAEGLPNALLEAMACGCVPIVANVSGMPSAVADKGFVLKKRQVEDAVELSKQALKKTDKDAEDISAYTKEKYAYAKRREFITQLINKDYEGNV